MEKLTKSAVRCILYIRRYKQPGKADVPPYSMFFNKPVGILQAFVMFSFLLYLFPNSFFP